MDLQARRVDTKARAATDISDREREDGRHPIFDATKAAWARSLTRQTHDESLSLSRESWQYLPPPGDPSMPKRMSYVPTKPPRRACAEWPIPERSRRFLGAASWSKLGQQEGTQCR